MQVSNSSVARPWKLENKTPRGRPQGKLRGLKAMEIEATQYDSI